MARSKRSLPDSFKRNAELVKAGKKPVKSAAKKTTQKKSTKKGR